MSSDLKTSFDLEPNPFERSFATKEDGETSTSSGHSSNNKHNLHIPNISSLNAGLKLPGITPPLFTPGGRKLPPLGLSPNGHMLNPGTPGSNLWSSLLTATNNQNEPNHPPFHGNPSYSQFLSAKKLGLTPNESNLRSGLTPGGMNHPGGIFPFASQVPGLTTPSALLNSPITPGLSSLLGMNGHGEWKNGAGVPGAGAANTAANTAANIANTTNIKPAPPAPSGPTEEIRHKLPEIKAEEPSPKRQKVESPKKEIKKETIKADKKPEPKKPKKGLSENDKRKSFLERNRVAASKCRQRKKQLMQKMEDELAFYSSGYRELSAQVQQLREQLINVRGVLIGHKDCGVLVSAVGGYDQLNNIIRLTDFAVEATSRTSTNTSSIPSTIPTTLTYDARTNSGSPSSGLGSVPVNGLTSSVSGASNFPVPPAPTTTTMAPQLPVQVDPHGANARAPTAGPGLAPAAEQGQVKLPSHHSLLDLPAAAAEEGNSFRPSHSMSNLAVMNQYPDDQRYEQQYGLRPVNSMVDLQHHNQQSYGLT